MKKMWSLLLLACASPLAANVTSSKSSVLTYNKKQLVMESKEGKACVEALEKKRRSFEEDLQKKEQEVRAMGERFQKQAPMLSAEARRKKERDLSKEIRDIERTREARLQELKIEFQEDFVEVEEKLKPHAVHVFKEKGASVLFDSSRPDVEAFDPQTDITKEAIKVADAAYEASKKGVSVEKKA